MTLSPHRRVVLALALISTLLQVTFFLGTAEAELLTEWFPDDAFYYLQPAWMFSQGHGFTFDGLEPTYGFQPLWACLLAALGAMLGSKSAMLTGALVIGSALHVTSGALLFRLLERGKAPGAGVIAAGLWLLNPDLVRVQATGMESGLAGVLLLAVLIELTEQRWSTSRVARLGALTGLLFLARVSLLPAVALAGWVMARQRGWRAFALWGGCALLVVVPWCLWADAELGRMLPLSGERKLVGAAAGLARFAASFPGVSAEAARGLLGPDEALLFDSRSLAAPSWERLWRLGPQATAGWALGHWLPRGVSAWDAARGGVVAALVGLALWSGRGIPRVPRGVWMLAGIAVVHAGAHHLLLNGYVHYGYWYRVPELMLVVLLAGLVLEPALSPRARRWGLPALVAGAALGAVSMGQALRPREFQPDADRYAVGVLSVAEAMNASLPPGARVGSWNAGLLGWLSDGPTVVNLDGLANSVEFLPVARAEVLFLHGKDIPNPTMRWLDDHDVAFLVDLQPLSGIGQVPFYDVIPAERYEPVLHSAPVTHWARPGRNHAVTLVEITPLER